jgi:NCAIR mutase (PurE)-related protein
LMNYNDPDPWRKDVSGVPEVVFAPGKNKDMLIAAIDGLLVHHPVLVTKCSTRQQGIIRRRYGKSVVRDGRLSGCMVITDSKTYNPEIVGKVIIACAGSADMPVAEEALISAEYLGIQPVLIADCGVAGPHRVDRCIARIKRIDPDAVIVIAGMEGALPSVIASRIKHPVIAVPTSVGYGTHYHGITPLLSMMNTCVPGVCVVNIDNGFGASAAAFKISLRRHIRTHKDR